ncbi:Wadjet anti-phage system protein JetD domain-containing protein, partial [Acinetobacter baumannii]
NVHTQIRVLDDELKPVLGYEECSLPLDDAAWLKWLPEKVFIIENQVCYLTFPKVKNAVAIFGEGFKSRLSRHIPWL